MGFNTEFIIKKLLLFVVSSNKKPLQFIILQWFMILSVVPPGLEPGAY